MSNKTLTLRPMMKIPDMVPYLKTKTLNLNIVQGKTLKYI